MEDDELLQKWWRPVALGAGVIILGTLGLNYYQKSAQDSNREIAAVYDQLLDERESDQFAYKLSELKPKLSGSSYESMVKLLEASHLISSEKFTEALSLLEKFAANKFSDKTTVSLPSVDVSPEQLLVEYEALLVARAELGSGNQELARKILRGLTLGADFLNVEALTVLANTGEDPAEIKKLSNELKDARPGLASLLASFGS